MNISKILAMVILGLGFSGAALILSIPMLFHSLFGGFELTFAAGSAGACTVLTVSALVLRKRLEAN